ncbi:hypothetical protein D3C71_1527310 [compost metagenome]
MQGVAGGAQAVAILGHVVDHPAAGQACRQQAEAAAQATLAGGADDCRDARQRHVVADVQVAADTDAANILGQAQAIDVDVVGVGELVSSALQRVVQVADCALAAARRIAERAVGDGHAARVEPGLRKDLGGLAVVETEGAAQPLGRPLGHDAPVAALARVQVMATADGGQRAAHRDQPRGAGVAEEEALGALAHHIRAAVVGAGFRQPCCIPVEEVLGADGQFGVDHERRRQLVARHEQFLGFGAR